MAKLQTITAAAVLAAAMSAPLQAETFRWAFQGDVRHYGSAWVI